MAKEKFRISTRVLIFNEENKVLILQCKRPRKEDGWDFPGGHLDKYEQVEEAAIREVQEETNLKISQLTLMETIVQEEKNKCLIYYAAKYKSGTIELSKEHKEFKWIEKDELQYYDFYYDSSIDIAKRGFDKEW